VTACVQWMHYFPGMSLKIENGGDHPAKDQMICLVFDFERPGQQGIACLSQREGRCGFSLESFLPERKMFNSLSTRR
jgi:hypothetical protein